MLTTNTTTLPTLRYLQLVCLLTGILYFGATLFIPMSYGLFIAIVLLPACKWLEKKGWPRSLAITASLSIIVFLSAALVILVVLEMQSFRKELPAIINKLTPIMKRLQKWLQQNPVIGLQDQKDWGTTLVNKLAGSISMFLPVTFKATGSLLFTLLMAPVFAVLFLYNRRVFTLFLEKMAGGKNSRPLHVILEQTANTYFKFIKGMTMVYLIVGLLNSLGLLALGIPHAFLFGMLTAILTIIPYAGIFIGALLPITVAWITKDSLWYPAGVIILFTFVQYLEANIIFPRVVAAQINVSTWATLVAIIVGGLIWGVAGMILFVPFTGILKIIADNIAGGKALSTLLSR